MREQPNIWYIHPYAGGPGVGRYDRAFNLVREWSRAGVQSVILVPSNHHLLDSVQSHGFKEIDGVRYHFVASPKYQGNGVGRIINMTVFSARLALQSEKLVRLYGKPTMIIASSPHPYAFLSAKYIAWRYKARCVFEVRDLWPLSLVELAGLSPAHPLVQLTGWIERYAYRHADTVVSLLPCTQEYMVSLGLEAHRWCYIPNGVDATQRMQTDVPAACTLLAQTWRREGRIVIALTGALGRPNHVESLIEAISLLHTQGHSNIAAILVGRGELQNELRAQIVTAGLEHSIVLFPQIAKASVLALLREVDVGYISLRTESLFRFGVSPNKLFDYMMAAIPIVFAVQAGNDPVREASCGISADASDPYTIAEAIQTLASLSPAERHAMGQRGHSYVLEKHNYASLAKDYMRLMG